MLARIAAVPPRLRSLLMQAATVLKPANIRERVGELGLCGPDLASIYFIRRRIKSHARLAQYGLRAPDLGLSPLALTPGALDGVPIDEDEAATISRLESSFYMRNMLLRDSDANGMAHSLEIRVPFLDRRMLDLAHSIPGSVRMPAGVADKHLLRTSFRDFLPPELLSRAKTGFWLPIGRWMLGPLRERSEAAIAYVRDSGLLRARPLAQVWRNFERSPDRVWSSAFLLVVLGEYLQRAGRSPAPAPRAATEAPRRTLPQTA
jgi:asparagine synthase (glutamine-hydrolysing)